MIVGGYVLHLYCDDPQHAERVGWQPQNHDEVIGEAGGECRRVARRRGWRLDLEHGTAVCPACTRAARATPAPSPATDPGSPG